MSTTQTFTELTARRMGPIRGFFARHPRVVDVVLILIYFFPALVTAAEMDPVTPVQGYGMIFTCLLSAALLWWRRSHPAHVMALLLVLTIVGGLVARVGPGTELAVVFTLYSIATTYNLRQVGAWFMGSSVAIYVAYYVSHFGTERANQALQIVDESGQVITGLPAQLGLIGFIMGFNLIAVLIGLNVRAKRQHVQSIIDRGNQLALERDQRAQLAVAEERQRIARELHDVVAHSLSVMITLAEGATVMVERDPQRARNALEQTATTGREALADMRTVLGVLRENEGLAELEPQPGGSLSELVAQFQHAGLPVTLQLQPGVIPHDTSIRLQLYRIMQESLTNVLRHAPHSPTISVTIRAVENMLELVVANDLAGKLPQPETCGTGRGLVGIRERVAALNGQMTAGIDDGWWRVHIRVPLPEQKEKLTDG